MSKDRNSKLTSYVKGALRRASVRWPARNEALVRARVERGKYKCEICHDLFQRQYIELDHIEPVISLKDGFVDWNTYIERLLPEAEGFQAICKNCHASKTAMEDMMRKTFAAQKRAAEKQKKIEEKLKRKKNEGKAK